MIIYKDKKKLSAYIITSVICIVSIISLLVFLPFFIKSREQGILNVPFNFGISSLIIAIGLILAHYIYEIEYYINQPKILMNINFDNLIIYYNESILSFSYSSIKINYHPNQDDKDAFFVKKG